MYVMYRPPCSLLYNDGLLLFYFFFFCWFNMYEANTISILVHVIVRFLCMCETHDMHNTPLSAPQHASYTQENLIKSQMR